MNIKEDRNKLQNLALNFSQNCQKSCKIDDNYLSKDQEIVKNNNSFG